MSKKNSKKKGTNYENIVIAIVSILGLIIGSIAFNFILSFLIIGILNLILFWKPLLKFLKTFKSKKVVRKKDKKKKNNTNNKNKNKNKKVKYILIAFFSLAILGLICAIIFFYIIVKNAPEFNPDKLYKSEASIIYDNEGKIIGKIGKEMREKITYEDMSETLIDAIIATEDARFFQHNGFDLPRFLKASFGQALGQDAGGASTLTMQIVKNHFTSTEDKGIKGIMRKFTDIYLSIFKVEKKYTKFEILEFYANSNYLGGQNYGGAYGVEQASQLYFGKTAKDLTLPEAALIAGLFQAPNGYDPYLYPEDAESRRKVVLYLMERHGYINKEERKLAESISIEDILIKHDEEDNGEYVGVINTVVDEVLKLTDKDPFSTAMEIYTTFDIDKQNHINKVLNGELYTWENEVVDAGIAVIDVKTGGIAAVSAGRHKKNLKGFNLATDMKRHIGSTSKPLFDYAPGIELNNWSTYHPFTDEPHSYSTGIQIHNWDLKYEGLTTLREALRTSRNIPALKAFQDISNKDLQKFITSLGLNPEIEGTLLHESHALGGYTGESPVTLAGAYAAFGNGGYYIKPHSVKKIIFKDSNETFENKVPKERVMSEATAYMVSDVLLDAARWGLYGNWNVNGVNYCAKTGTSNFPPEVFEHHNLPSNAVNDLWIASYNPDYAIAQWYGYDEISSKYYNRFGTANYRVLFQTVAKGIYKENKNFTRPKDVISVQIEKDTVPAMLPSKFTPKNMIITELFKKGTEPTDVSKRFDTLDNPTNISAEQEGNKINISWNPIAKPNAIDKDYLTQYSKKIFNNNKEQTKFLNSLLSYNSKNIGDLGYNVYIKENGSLKLLGFTKNTNFKTNAIGGNVTYVVKSTYSIFSANMSSGVETTISQTGSIISNITSELFGDKEITINVGDSYTEFSPSINVYDGTNDITNLAEITKQIKIENTGEVVSKIDTSKPNTFIITYTVNYSNYSNTHKRIVIVK